MHPRRSDAAPDATGPARRPTMGDVAAQVGVSRQLVSLVLRDAPGASEETRRRVLQAADELGYSPDVAAQMLRRSSSKYLGVLFNPAHASGAGIVEHLHTAAHRRGFRLVLSSASPGVGERTAVEELLGYRSEALVLIATTLAPESIARLAARVPVVSVGQGSIDNGCDVVRSAGDLGVAQAVEHLAGLGHRAIAYVHARDMASGGVRRVGYEAAVRRLGLRPHVLTVRGDYTEEAGAHACTKLLREPELPTAMIMSNDHAALGLVMALCRAGLRVPEDMSVVGYDDSRIARLSFLRLTSVRQDDAEMSEAALQCVLDRVSGARTQPVERVTSATLVVRDSTAPPPAERARGMAAAD